MEHYYSSKQGSRGPLSLISDIVRGVSIELYTSPGVFSKNKIDLGTRLLVENAWIPDEGRVLDLGCGYGVIGIVLAKLNPRLEVYMVDINPQAVKLARLNAKRNNVEERVRIYQGNLFDPLPVKVFKAIYSNPPLSAGAATLEKLLLESLERLEENGKLQLVLKKGGEKIVKIAQESNYNVEIEKHNKKGYMLLTITKRSRGARAD